MKRTIESRKEICICLTEEEAKEIVQSMDRWVGLQPHIQYLSCADSVRQLVYQIQIGYYELVKSPKPPPVEGG